MDSKRFPTSPPAPVEMTSARKLEELLKERSVLEQMRSKCPVSWNVLDAEISRLQLEAKQFATLTASGLPQSMASNSSETTEGSHSGTATRRSSGGGVGGKKRVKLPIPADKYPEYNFVGRLLGPRGATLKTLERETGCKIMIRGKGSIRKDKENEVRGKPGWEHVFNEPLHVVIEADTEEPMASRALIRAKEAIELLLVPVPEENDSLKRQQLRDLAILNGTFRGTSDGKENGSALGSQARRSQSGLRSNGNGNGRDFSPQTSDYGGMNYENNHDLPAQLNATSMDSLAQDMSRSLTPAVNSSTPRRDWNDSPHGESDMSSFGKTDSSERFASLGSGASYYGGAFSSHASMVREPLLPSQTGEHTRVQ
mmetsp:Transcript_5208/g.15578  ORF Transcript_5208/g.15578 Transcript_5208/m.15578 type:complete len:369 (+) Transcript_5208:498-1604(+)